MSRELRTFQPLEGPAEALTAAFASDPSGWLPTSTAGARPVDDGIDGAGTWMLCVHPGSLPRPVRATVSQPWHAMRTSWRSLSWEPVTVGDEHARADQPLPLDGELGLHVDRSGRATLVLDARYLTPDAPPGAAGDTDAVDRTARQTGRRFLSDVRTGLSRVAADVATGVAQDLTPGVTAESMSEGASPRHARPTALD